MIRPVLALWLCSVSGVMACPAPSGAIDLRAEDAAAPMAYATMAPPPLSAPFALVVGLCPAPGTKVTALAFDAIMPAHQHGMNFGVDIAALGQNRFTVSNVVFHMPGLWALQVTADVDGRRHVYTADVVLE